MRKALESGARSGTAWVAAAIVAAASLAAGACAESANTVTGGTFRDLPADQIMFDLETDIKDLGVMRARLRADTAYVWDDSAKMVMHPVDLRLFDDNGGQTARLTATEGEHDTRTNIMVARGNVVLVTTEGNRRILTEELRYDPSIGRLWSDVHTVFYDGETRLEGEGFRADDRMNDVEVFKSVGENIPLGF
jgi:LPS export ABC transporter protein LptC